MIFFEAGFLCVPLAVLNPHLIHILPRMRYHSASRQDCSSAALDMDVPVEFLNPPGKTVSLLRTSRHSSLKMEFFISIRRTKPLFYCLSMRQGSGLVRNGLSTQTCSGGTPHTPQDDTTSYLSTLSSELRILEHIVPLMFQQCWKMQHFRHENILSCSAPQVGIPVLESASSLTTVNTYLQAMC